MRNLVVELECCLISGTVAVDPKLTLQFIRNLVLGHISPAFPAIGFSARTQKIRTSSLAALPDYVATMPNEEACTEPTAWTIAIFTHGLAQNGFAFASQGIAGANLALNDIANYPSDTIKSHKAGQWIE